MDIRKPLLLPFIVGLILLFYSWYVSYPISINSVDAYVFNGISLYYWFSVPLLLVSMFLIAHFSKSNILKWLLTFGIVLVLYSSSFFFFSMPTSDSQYFRGLTEYFLQTKDLNPLVPNHNYYQWPLYFVLSQIVISESGLSVINYEFILYVVIGLLLTTGLYVYASRVFKNTAFVAVTAFFISTMVLFLNYQAVPFSLGLGLLLLIFMLESGKPTVVNTITEGLLYVGMLFTHAFVPLFFVIYCLSRGILDKSKKYVLLFVFSILSYFLVQLSIARFSFLTNIAYMLNVSPEFSSVVDATIQTPVIIPIDNIAQFYSRIVILGFIAISSVGFILLLLKRKLSTVDKTVLLVGLIYSGLGLVMYTLGTRAVAIVFIPLSLGAAYLFQFNFSIRYRKLLKKLISITFVVLLVLFLFVSMHQTFNAEIQFQSKTNYETDNFLISHFNLTDDHSILMDFRSLTYVSSKINSDATFFRDLKYLNSSDIVFYTVALEKELDSNFTQEAFFHEEFNRLYDDGSSFIAVRTPG